MKSINRRRKRLPFIYVPTFWYIVFAKYTAISRVNLSLPSFTMLLSFSVTEGNSVLEHCGTQAPALLRTADELQIDGSVH